MAVLLNADQDLLHKLLLGQLPTAEVERLATEYADDGRLAELAESLAGKDDALLALLHNHQTAVVDPEGERLVERLLERLKPALPDKPRDDTAAMNKADASTEPSSPDVTGKPLKLPERLEYYRPIKVLGQGGMGTVYLAEDTRLGREVAIKTLRPELAINPQAKERFLREARSAAKLEHDHVIPIYSVGEAADGTPFLAMPLLKGEPLDALIRRTAGPLPVAMVVRLAREAASGLAAAHERGLIHRDIKPANIWLEAPTGRVKILDFGLAKAADAGDDVDSETHLTASGAIVGTPAYMAPEQASGHPVDGRADLFSLGCVLYELLAGKRAFSGPNTMSILMSLANHTPPAPDKISPQCPAALSRLVMQLLEKDPANRPASAVAVIQALAELDTESVPASRAASAPGPSQDATTVRGLTPSGSPTDLRHPSDSSLTLPATAVLPVRERSIPKQRVALALVGALLLLLVAVVYRIQTDQGTLLVEVDEDAAAQIETQLKAGGLEFHDKVRERKWVVKPRQPELNKSGTYRVEPISGLQLTVSDDTGAELNTDEFKLKRHGKIIVRVSVTKIERAEDRPVASIPNDGSPIHSQSIASSPLDKLDPAAIPADERFDYQPKELVAVIGSLARRHWNSATGAAISPDGKLAATLSTADSDLEKNLILWDMTTQTVRSRLNVRCFNAGQLWFTPDSRRLVVLPRSHPISVFDLGGPEPVLVPLNNQAERWEDHVGAILEEGRTLAVPTPGYQQISLHQADWQQASISKRVTLSPPMKAWAFAFATAASQIAYVSPEGKLHRATIRDGQWTEDVELPIPLAEGVRLRALSPEGHHLAIVVNNEMQIWDLRTQPPVKRGQSPSGIDTLASFSPGGRWMVDYYTQTRLFRIDGAEPKQVGYLDQWGTTYPNVSFSADGNRAVIVTGYGFVRFWDLSGDEPRELSPWDPSTAFPAIQRPTLHPADGRLLLQRYDSPSGIRSRRQVWSLGTRVPTPFPNSQTFLEPYVGGHVLPVGRDGYVALCEANFSAHPGNITGGSEQYSFDGSRWGQVGEAIGERDVVGDTSSDGRWLVTMSRPSPKELVGWNLSVDPPAKRWTLPFGERELFPWEQVRLISISANQRWLGALLPREKGSGKAGAELLLVDQLDGEPKEVARIPLPTDDLNSYRFAFSADGRWLAHNKNRSMELVLEDLSGPQPKPIQSFAHDAAEGHERAKWLSFSPDGCHLAYGGERQASVFEVPTLKRVWQWRSPGPVTWIEWAADGRHLVTLNNNQTVYVLRLNHLAPAKAPAIARPSSEAK